MTLQEIAAELVAGCREGRERENLDRLYHPAAISVEPVDFGQGRVTEGVAGIKGKHDWWEANFDVHGTEVDGPYLFAGEGGTSDRFAVNFAIDTTEKASGRRMTSKEVALYTVEDGRIVREEFFAAP